MNNDGVQVQVPQMMVVMPDTNVSGDVGLAESLFAAIGVAIAPGPEPRIEARPEG